MSSGDSTDPRRPPLRRWRIPPPVLRDSGAPGPEGFWVLQEVHGALGVVLWKVLRAVLLQARASGAPSDHRLPESVARELVEQVQEFIPLGAEELRAELLALVRFVAASDPSSGPEIAARCLWVKRWLDAEGSALSALEFLQAAALSDSSDARVALEIGHCCLELSQHARAESWLQRAIGLARRSDDWEAYVRAYLLQGNLLDSRGAGPAAERCYQKATRRAMRHGLDDLLAPESPPASTPVSA